MTHETYYKLQIIFLLTSPSSTKLDSVDSRFKNKEGSAERINLGAPPTPGPVLRFDVTPRHAGAKTNLLQGSPI